MEAAFASELLDLREGGGGALWCEGKRAVTSARARPIAGPEACMYCIIWRRSTSGSLLHVALSLSFFFSSRRANNAQRNHQSVVRQPQRSKGVQIGRRGARPEGHSEEVESPKKAGDPTKAPLGGDPRRGDGYRRDRRLGLDRGE